MKNKVEEFRKIEKKWQKKWEQKGIFNVKESKKKKFYVLEMFPYPSGRGLHMGQAFNYVLGDIYARFKRMNGFNVLHPIGFDSFGLPAENAAIKEKVSPKKYTEKAISNFIKQLKSLGISYDWSRMIKTHEPEYYKWDQWIFLQLLKKGLVLKKKSAVNWCRKCNTALANEQVHNGKCWRHSDTDVEIKQLEQWFFKITDYADELYEDIKKLEKWPEDVKAMQKHWIGKSKGISVDFKINGEKWPVFTTRPDTIYGVTFMVVSAQHPRLMELVTKEQKQEVEKLLKKIKSTSEKGAEELEKEGAFTGSYAINPINNDKVPVYVGNFVLAGYGSGMVMAVPAHDQRDFEFAKKYNLKIKEVIRSSLLGVIAGVDKKIENEFKKLNLDYKFKDNIYFIKSSSSRKKQIFGLIQKYMNKDYYSHIWVNGEIFVILKNKIYNISKEDEFEEAQKRINKLKIPKEYSNLSKIKKQWKSFIFDEVWSIDLKQAYVDDGVLVNSGKFDALDSKEAIDVISDYLEEKKLGKRTVQFKLRDWLISRQRYWGTPIPIIYCDKCGIVPVPEKDLPVELPEKVKFGKGNPLETAKSWIKTKCPKCGGEGRRETDTMDTFVNSSWYFLRYCDSKNKKKIFEPEKANYWMPIDLYIGGKEHACMHLIYFRFYHKFLRDLGFVNCDEPTYRYFAQGMIHGSDGYVMSKSRGNVIDPLDVIEKYGTDSLRIYLFSSASPNKDFSWSDKAIKSSLRFLDRIMNYFSKFKAGKPSERVESKINKAIKEISFDVENLQYNLAIIKLRELFEVIEKEKISKKYAEVFVKLLSVFCPHIAEELWFRLGNKTFVSSESWPVCDEKKIDEKFEKQEKAQDKLVSDINNVIDLVKKKQKKEIKKVYVYVLPKEKEVYDWGEVGRRVGKEIEVFSVDDKKKYDPENKSGKVKFGKPGIYVE